MVVLERRLQPMTVLRGLSGLLGGRRHDDVGVTVAIVAVSPMRMLDHLDEAVPVGRSVQGVAVEIFIVVAVRHGAILSGRARTLSDATARQQQPHQPGRGTHQLWPRLADRVVEGDGFDQGRLEAVE